MLQNIKCVEGILHQGCQPLKIKIRIFEQNKHENPYFSTKFRTHLKIGQDVLKSIRRASADVTVASVSNDVGVFCTNCFKNIAIY